MRTVCQSMISPHCYNFRGTCDWKGGSSTSNDVLEHGLFWDQRWLQAKYITKTDIRDLALSQSIHSSMSVTCFCGMPLLPINLFVCKYSEDLTNVMVHEWIFCVNRTAAVLWNTITCRLHLMNEIPITWDLKWYQYFANLFILRSILRSFKFIILSLDDLRLTYTFFSRFILSCIASKKVSSAQSTTMAVSIWITAADALVFLLGSNTLRHPLVERVALTYAQNSSGRSARPSIFAAAFLQSIQSWEYRYVLIH